MAEKTTIAAAINIVAFLVLSVILLVDSIDELSEAIGILLVYLVGASIILTKVEPRCEIFFHASTTLLLFHSAAEHIIDQHLWASLNAVFVFLFWIYWIYSHNKPENKEAARTFFYWATWFVFGVTLFQAIFGVIVLLMIIINVAYNESTIVGKEDILFGSGLICIVVLVVSSWIVAMKDELPLLSEEKSDEHEKEQELQSYELMT